MKKIVALSIICLIAIGVSGCEKNDREFFDTDYSALNIWVGTSTAPYETFTYNFKAHNDMDYVTFYARVTGQAVDYDRTFKLEAVGGHISKVNFYLEDEYVIPAGEYSVSYPIYFGKPDNYDEFRYSEGYVIFRMVSDHFEQGARSTNGVDMDRIHMTFQNSLVKPADWEHDSGMYLRLKACFGSYSEVKYEFMISVMGFMDFRIYSRDDITDQPDNVISLTQAQYWANKCKTALANFNNDPANIASGKAPLKNEFGFVVSFDD